MVPIPPPRPLVTCHSSPLVGNIENSTSWQSESEEETCEIRPLQQVDSGIKLTTIAMIENDLRLPLEERLAHDDAFLPLAFLDLGKLGGKRSGDSVILQNPIQADHPFLVGLAVATFVNIVF
jgi:hypothetical protein